MKNVYLLAAGLLIIATNSSAFELRSCCIEALPADPATQSRLVEATNPLEARATLTGRPRMMAGPDGVDLTADSHARSMIHWYVHAADQGNPLAQFKLGLLYLDGKILQQDHHRALLWLTASAEQGSIQAQLLLSSMYLKGMGTDRDPSMARKWFNTALSLTGTRDDWPGGRMPATLVF